MKNLLIKTPPSKYNMLNLIGSRLDFIRLYKIYIHLEKYLLIILFMLYVGQSA